MREINITIEADDDLFMRQDDDAPWSWMLYPPSFILQGLLVAGMDVAPVHMLAVAADNTQCESALYMMEYRDVEDLCLVELSAQRMAIAGKVDFFGKSLPFSIDMPRVA